MLSHLHSVQRYPLQRLHLDVLSFWKHISSSLSFSPLPTAITPSELLPMPAPFRPSTGAPPRSSRRRARWAATREAIQLANQMAGVVSSLALNTPQYPQVRGALSRIPCASRMNKAQKEAAAMFLARARSFARRGVSHLRGGTAVVAEQLSASLSHGLYNRPRNDGHSNVDAAFLVAARVSLPPAGAVVPVGRYLSASWVERLSASDGLLRADCRAAFGYSVRPGDPPQLSASEVGRLMPKPVFLINRS